MRGKAISDETRAAIAADLGAGDSRAAVAARYGVAERTVARYSPLDKRGRAYRNKLVAVSQLGDLYLELLGKNFAALGALADYIAAHPKEAAINGQGIGHLYGVVFDKTGRLAGAAMAGAGLLPPALPGDSVGTKHGPLVPDDEESA